MLRNVLKRYERIHVLMTKNEWKEGGSVFGLPKMKQVKIKARKADSKEKEETSTTTETPAATPSEKAKST